jgi:hypothetical protein
MKMLGKKEKIAWNFQKINIELVVPKYTTETYRSHLTSNPPAVTNTVGPVRLGGSCRCEAGEAGDRRQRRRKNH